MDAVHGQGLSSLFVVATFPAEVYDNAIVDVQRMASKIHDGLPKSKKKQGLKYLEGAFGFPFVGGVDDATLKDMYDERFSVEIDPSIFPTLRNNIGNTGQSVERFLVYLQMGQHAQVPLTLARGKLRSFSEFTARLSKAMAKELKAAIGDPESPASKLEQALTKHVFGKAHLPIPLLPGYIIGVAEERGISIIDSFRYIRESPTAASFRHWFWSSRRALHPFLAGDVLDGARVGAEVESLGKRIMAAKSWDGSQVPIKWGVLRTSGIPVIGHYLQALGLKSLSLPKAFWRPESYEVFMAEWFKSRSGKIRE